MELTYQYFAHRPMQKEVNQCTSVIKQMIDIFLVYPVQSASLHIHGTFVIVTGPLGGRRDLEKR